jgi:hypothetical protein
LAFSQSYKNEIEQYREKYKKEFLEDDKSPLKKDDLPFLRFYAPDPAYRVKGNFLRIEDKTGFDMQTHNGVIKKYYIYGSVTFELKKQTHTLFVYQSEKLRSKECFEDYLFIPFTDETNYAETFGGGRYLDFRFKDIERNRLIIDFNKCYNPYCAFKEGYACPIPPKENDMKISIRAGEKLFGKEAGIKEK